MGGSFGGMMLRHAEHINGTAIMRANAACEPTKKKMSKASQKLLDDLDAEMRKIKDKHASSRADAVLIFNSALMRNTELFANAGLVKSGDTLMTILNRVKCEVNKLNYTETDIETIRNNVIDCIADQMGVSFDEVVQAKHKDDLGVDSLDSIEIVMRLEEEFSVEITDYDMERFTDVDSIVKHLSGLRKLEIVKRELQSKRTPSSIGTRAIISHHAFSRKAESESESESKNETDLVTLELRNVSELLHTEYMKAGTHEFVQKFDALFSSGYAVAQVVAPKTVGQCDGWHIDLSGRINEDDASAINHMLIDAGFYCVSVTDHVRDATLNESSGAFRSAARVFSRVYFTLFASE